MSTASLERSSRHSSSMHLEAPPQEEASTPTIFESFRYAGRHFAKDEREKMLTALKAVAGIVKTALVQAGGSGGGAQATGELGNVASIGLGCWGIVSVPFKIMSTFDALNQMIEICNNPEAKTRAKVAAVTKLLFKELAGLGKSLCSSVIFISQYVVKFAPVGVISALGITGGVLGIIASFYELVGCAIMLYGILNGDIELTGLAGAVLALKSIAALAGLALAVMTLVVLIGGAVFNPWVLPALVAFAILASIVYVIVEKVYEHQEASKKAALAEQQEANKVQQRDQLMEEIGNDFRQHVPAEKITALRTRLGQVDPGVKDEFFSVSSTEESGSGEE